METSQFLAALTQIHGEARARGLLFRQAEGAALSGRTVVVDGQPLLSFSSCSYLGLEQHPALVQGVVDAVRAYGTQFSTSRGYVSAPAYAELEALLSEIFGGHALATPSTTLGHHAAIPALLTEQDAMLLDHQVHHSVQMAARIAQANGTRVEIVRHGDSEGALAQARQLLRRHRHVWFACDGVFSMYGDLAPVGLLRALQALSDRLWLYVDDAHGMSWAGTHGRGSFLSRMPLNPRMVFATSLNKAFSAGGGCLVFPDPGLRRQVMDCGGPMVFSGPIQPPMLGAAVASARLHLSDEIIEHQAVLAGRCAHVNARMDALGLPLLVKNEAPIFFVRAGLPRVAFAVAERMMADGIYVNTATFPAVPMRRAGIRFAVTSLHSEDELDRALGLLARHHAAVLAEEQLGRAELDALFQGAVAREAETSAHYYTPSLADVLDEAATLPLAPATLPAAPTLSEAETAGLAFRCVETIAEVPAADWDAVLGGAGCCSWEAQRAVERIFSDQPRPEHRARFHYMLVRDSAGRLVAATFFSEVLGKDDMMMREEVSEAIERRRADDPYLLTSRILMMGSHLSEGCHLYLDRAGPWRAALRRILDEAGAIRDRVGATSIVLRDLPEGDGPLDRELLRHGFARVPILPSHHIRLVPGEGEADWVAGLGRKRRRNLTRLLRDAAPYRVRVWRDGLPPGPLRDRLYPLYRAVADRRRRINVFPLPETVIDELGPSPVWELVTVHLPPAHGGPAWPADTALDAELRADGVPVAFYAAHHHGADYAPLLCGLDYDYVRSHGSYRVMLLEIVRRARALGAERLHLGMDADRAKRRMGAEARDMAIYAQVEDHFSGELLREVVAELGLGAG